MIVTLYNKMITYSIKNVTNMKPFYFMIPQSISSPDTLTTSFLSLSHYLLLSSYKIVPYRDVHVINLLSHHLILSYNLNGDTHER